MDRHTYASGPLAGLDDLYCDTSFLLDIYAASLLTTAEPPVLSSRQEQRAEQADRFFRRCIGLGAQVVTSVLALEEAFHVLLWQFVREDINDSNGAWRNWKQYRAADTARFLEALDSGRQEMMDFDTFWRTEGILLLHGGQQLVGPPISELHLVNDARQLVDRLEVDVMDAFHYSAMRRFGLSNAASSDSDWAVFPSGRLYTFEV